MSCASAFTDSVLSVAAVWCERAMSSTPCDARSSSSTRDAWPAIVSSTRSNAPPTLATADAIDASA